MPEHIDAVAPSWHEFKNSTVVESGLLHSHPFMDVHFHFLIIVELTTLQMLLQLPK
jgi:hypothetical protein